MKIATRVSGIRDRYLKGAEREHGESRPSLLCNGVPGNSGQLALHPGSCVSVCLVEWHGSLAMQLQEVGYLRERDA